MHIAFDYDTTYPGPAFPIMEFIISGRETGDEERVIGYIDSGADGSLIPIQILENIGARLINDSWARTVSGERYVVNLYAVNFRVGTHTLYGINVAANEQTNEVMIGRDVLNQLIVTLNGLAELTEITD